MPRSPDITILSVDDRFRCGVCGDPLGERVVTCFHCGVAQHLDCKSFVGGCGTYGCRGNGPFTPPPRPRLGAQTMTRTPGRRWTDRGRRGGGDAWPRWRVAPRSPEERRARTSSPFESPVECDGLSRANEPGSGIVFHVFWTGLDILLQLFLLCLTGL